MPINPTLFLWALTYLVIPPMSLRKILVLVIVFTSFCVQAQVKIGQNPNSINSASIVELESTDKAFVLTRISTAQMQAIVEVLLFITPIRIVYTITMVLHGITYVPMHQEERSLSLITMMAPLL